MTSIYISNAFQGCLKVSLVKQAVITCLLHTWSELVLMSLINKSVSFIKTQREQFSFESILFKLVRKSSAGSYLCRWVSGVSVGEVKRVFLCTAELGECDITSQTAQALFTLVGLDALSIKGEVIPAGTLIGPGEQDASVCLSSRFDWLQQASVRRWMQTIQTSFQKNRKSE